VTDANTRRTLLPKAATLPKLSELFAVLGANDLDARGRRNQ